jgi:hypothetical protein
MPADPPNVIQVPVKRYDISISLHDILTPLTQFAAQAHVVQAGSVNPEVQQSAVQLGQLVSQLRDVVSRLNAIDPSLLAPPAPQPQTAPPTTKGSTSS